MQAIGSHISSSSCAEPLPKRHAGDGAGSAAAATAADSTGDDTHPDGTPLTAALVVDQVRSIIASYLNVVDLVTFRRVSSSWLHWFSQQCCWKGTTFEPSPSRLKDSTLSVIRVDMMPYLEQLSLQCYMSAEGDKHMQAILQQLAAGHNKSLRTLSSRVNIDATVIAALPALEDVTVWMVISLDPWKPMKFSGSFVQHLPSTLKKLRVRTERGGHGSDMVNYLLQHPLPNLEQLGRISATPEQLRQLQAAQPRLTTLELVISFNKLPEAIVAELQSAARLTDLTLSDVKCSAKLIDALCELRSLRTLHIEPPKYVEMPSKAFWKRLPKLRLSMIDHLPADQRSQQAQLVQIHIGSPHSHFETPQEYDEADDWWLAAIKASWVCNSLHMFVGDIDDDIWEQAVEEMEGQTSVLQRIRDDCYVGGLSERTRAYAKCHHSVTELHVYEETRRWTGTPDLIPHFPRLTSLWVTLFGDTPLAPIVQALRASGILHQLKCFVVEGSSHGALQVMLPAVKDAVSLEYIKVGGTLEEFADLQHADIRRAVAHAHQVELEVVKTSEPSKRDIVVARELLSLPTMYRISFITNSSTKAPLKLFSSAEVAAIRRAAGLNSVIVM